MVTPGGMRTAFFDEREDRYKPAADLELCDPAQVAESVHVALTRAPVCEVRELVFTPSGESSWPSGSGRSRHRRLAQPVERPKVSAA